jgi:hypothetical protein
MVKKLLASFAVLFVMLPAALSCGPAPSASDNALVPPAANTVVRIQVDKIVKDPALKAAYEELVKSHPDWPQTADNALNQVLNKTGLDLSNTSSALFFADIESAGETQNMYAGVIVTGAFSQSTLITKIQEQAKQTLTTTDYKGLTVYAGTQDKFEIVFLSQSQFVAGTAKAVRDTIDVRKGDQKALSGSVIDTLDRFGAAVITGAFAPPEALRSQLGKSVPQQPPLSLAAFQNIDTIGFSVDFPSLSMSARVDAHFTNSGSVQDARDAITGLISIAKGTSQDTNVKTALGNVQVAASGSWLTIRETMSAPEIASLAGSLQPKK